MDRRLVRSQLRRHRGRRVPRRLPRGDSPRQGGEVRTDAALLLGAGDRATAGRSRPAPATIAAAHAGQCRRRLGRRRSPTRCRRRRHRPAAEAADDGPAAGRARRAFATCRSSPTSTTASISRARATTASGSARSTKPRSIRAMRRPRRSMSPSRSTASRRRVDWPVEAVERKWAGLRTFAPDRLHEVRLRSAMRRASSGASARAAWASRPRRRRPCCARR